TGLAGTAVTGLGWSAERPCPPPSLSIAGGTAVNSTCVQENPGDLPVLVLTSAAASGSHAWTFGHVFRRGDVPAGSNITTDSPNSQAEVRNRWSDGSVKYAVLSGIASFTQNSPRNFALATTSATPPSGSVPEPTTVDVAITFSGDLSGTYSLNSVLGVDRSSWNKSQGGRVRRIPGPV